MGGGVSNISHKDKAELHHTDGITASQKTRVMTFIATKSSPMGEVLRTVLEEEHVIDPDTQTIPLDHTDNLHKVLDHVLHDMVEEAKTHRDDPTANALLVGPGRQDRQNQAIKKRVMQRFAYVPARAVTANEFCDIVEQVRFATNMSCCSATLMSEAACAGGVARGHRQEGQGSVRLPRRGQGTVAVATCLRPLVWGRPSSALIPLTTYASHLLGCGAEQNGRLEGDEIEACVDWMLALENLDVVNKVCSPALSTAADSPLLAPHTVYSASPSHMCPPHTGHAAHGPGNDDAADRRGRRLRFIFRRIHLAVRGGAKAGQPPALRAGQVLRVGCGRERLPRYVRVRL